MARVVLCWELGAGNGHLTKLVECVKPLIEQGHQICLVARNLAAVKNFDIFKNIDIYQAPVLIQSTQEHQAVNYSSVLLMCGYDNSDNLYLVLKAWRALFNTIGADFVIAEHAPTALLAANSLSIPHAMYGSGFTVPPLLKPMPTMTPWQQVTKQRLAEVDALVLGFINGALEKINPQLPKYDALNSVFSNAYKWIIDFPEVDHYGARSIHYFRRNRPLLSKKKPVWKEGNGDKVFVYLYANSPHLVPLLNQLNALKLPVLAVVPGLNTKVISKFDNTNIRIQTELVNIDDVAEQCETVISHGAYSAVVDFLLKGLPSLLLPSTVEQTMLAYQLGVSQLAFSGNPDAKQLDIAKMLKTMKTVDKVWENARIFAEKYKSNEQTDSLSDALQKALV